MDGGYIKAIDFLGDYKDQKFKVKGGSVVWESISWRGNSCFISRVVEKGGKPFMLGLNYIGRYIHPDTLLLPVGHLNKNLKMKTYLVNIDMVWSEQTKVKANSLAEAKGKAWEKFIKNPPRRNFKTSAERTE